MWVSIIHGSTLYTAKYSVVGEKRQIPVLLKLMQPVAGGDKSKNQGFWALSISWVTSVHRIDIKISVCLVITGLCKAHAHFFVYYN